MTGVPTFNGGRPTYLIATKMSMKECNRRFPRRECNKDTVRFPKIKTGSHNICRRLSPITSNEATSTSRRNYSSTVPHPTGTSHFCTEQGLPCGVSDHIIWKVVDNVDSRPLFHRRIDNLLLFLRQFRNPRHCEPPGFTFYGAFVFLAGML